MDPHRWAKIESLYHAALEKESGERPAYLAAACEQDSGLRREVESLLGCANVALASPVSATERWPAGFHLGWYEILGPLGAGGMGVVYRARDTRLQREVAIKVLPPEFQADPMRLARFQREAQILASLNHPHIAAIYGLEEFQGVRFLVLELVEGPTLAERLASGPIEVRQALRIAIEIADALEGAHGKGVIHRDLKPANIKLTGPESSSPGKVKVLDFGLAKGLENPASGANPANSPTVTVASVAGLIMGTPAYMSPEQAQGKPLDQRTDIWSFGVVLYEMLTGRRPFEGKTIPHIMVHVLEQEPDWNALPAGATTGVRELLESCVEKDSTQRPRDAGDLRLQLQRLARHAAVRPLSTTPPAQPPRLPWLAWSVAAIACLAAVLLAWLYFSPKPPARELVRLEIPPPDNLRLTSALRVSPDGRRLAFVARGADGIDRLWVRSLESFDARLLGAAVGTVMPFWSPDSRFIVYGNASKVYKIEAAGGPPEAIVEEHTLVAGGFWTRDGKIVLGNPGGLHQYPASGGPGSILATLDPSRHEVGHPFASLLPDGTHFLYTGAAAPISGNIFIGSLNDKPEDQHARMLLADVASALYAPSPDPYSGYLLFVREGAKGSGEGTLMAQPFDNRHLELKDSAVPIAEHVDTLGFSASATDVLVYRTGPFTLPASALTPSQFTWFDPKGNVLGKAGESGLYDSFALSPDDKRLAFERRDTEISRNIWLLDFGRARSTRFSFGGADELPVWSADGARIEYRSRTGGLASFYVQGFNGAASNKLILQTPLVGSDAAATSWSHDGRYLLYTRFTEGNNHLWVHPLGVVSGNQDELQITRSRFNESWGRFSPGDRWIAYISNASGRREIYVRPFESSGPSTSADTGELASTAGGSAPHWRSDARELYYLAPDGTVMAVEVTHGPVFHAGVPRALFKVPAGVNYFEVSADGKRFLIAVPVETRSAGYKVVLNWTEAMKR